MIVGQRLGALLSRLTPGRLAALAPIVGLFIAVNTLVRLGLAAFGGDPHALAPVRLLPALAIGFLFDLGVATFLAAPLALLIGFWPSRGGRSLRWVIAALLLPLCLLALFTAAAEFTFWNEFSSRFNFIAVDYLVYTHEVIGNIVESYNLPLLFGGLAVATLALWALALRLGLPPLLRPRAVGQRRIALLAALLPVVAYFAMDESYKEFSDDAVANEIAGNGYFDIFHAFWFNEIDYDRFYATLPVGVADSIIAQEVALRPAPAAPLDVPRPFERAVRGRGPEQRHNVVLVTIESMSAEFMAAFGNKRGLTPNLDRMAKEGLFFTKLYATGTRTVRGLEAVTLSMPPTPGSSVVKRPDNGGLFSIGSVFADHGYDRLFLYGGYSYFDNMQAFFAGNGYTVVDRTALSKADIHGETIWGVSDEDLFSLTLRELDRRTAEGRKVFAHVMTTSNHRPYVYPDGRIDIPSGKGRNGAVKYTDWAIGRFIEEARSRPWFADTVFVFLADHTHRGRGRQDLPIENYHIPMVIYAPGIVAPATYDRVMSQIDVPPTVLGLLDFSYVSWFFGQDVLADPPPLERALMANYQTVGLYNDGLTVELKPNRRIRVVDAGSGQEDPAAAARKLPSPSGATLGDLAISYYEEAAEAFSDGALRLAARCDPGWRDAAGVGPAPAGGTGPAACPVRAAQTGAP